MEWVDLIGKPFEVGARGPKSYDCYGLVKEVSRRMGKDIPDYPGDRDLMKVQSIMELESHRNRWQPTTPDMPDSLCPVIFKNWWGEDHTFGIVPGAMIVFSVRGYGAHVGVVVGPDLFLHVWEDHDATTQRISLWKNKIRGIYIYEG